MLRSICKTILRQHQQKRKFSLSPNYGKSNVSLGRQGKIMNKLFGERVSGSKKRWYPIPETAGSPMQGGHMIFQAKQLSKPGGAGKNSSRRSAILNKLFMEQISSLLATGAIAETFLGRGLQLIRVKISPDFARVNVYWLGNGDPEHDAKLADDLQRNSGLIRHELSQLRVMGEVPRIHFVQDKTYANVEQVETLLKNISFEDADVDSDEAEQKIDFRQERVKHEFYGQNIVTTQNASQTAVSHNPLPAMRHDVFGLDHREIVTRILTKMRKTKQAWETHAERQEKISADYNFEELTKLKTAQIKIMEENETKSEEFSKFLAKRRDRKNTPERKKYRNGVDVIYVDNFEDGDIIVSSNQRPFLTEEDYLDEENEDEEKK